MPDYLRSLDLAVNQYKLALRLRGEPSTRLIGMTYGKFALSKDELALSREDIELANSTLRHCTTFLLAVTVETALGKVFGKPLKSADANVVTAARIAKVLRNAFAHDPFYPSWKFQDKGNIGHFEIPGVISVNTMDLEGKPVIWEDYEGQIALLNFVEHCKSLIREELAKRSIAAQSD